MSGTPRTDEQAGALIDAEEVVPADFARELERENAALRKDKERLDLLNTLRQYYSRPPLCKVSGWAWSIVDERDERTGDIRDSIDAIINKSENDKITYHKGPEFMASGVAIVHTFSKGDSMEDQINALLKKEIQL